MKERASFTFDKETIKIIEDLINSGNYRNKSHVVEKAIKFLGKTELAKKEGKDAKTK
jgi:Arc/MetJ-type ribon-helix-helix transcriptional regulator